MINFKILTYDEYTEKRFKHAKYLVDGILQRFRFSVV